ncbi:mitochondrial ribosomal protein L33 isoform X2 [Calliopsis andreniformis]|uniref:mitochondrial ribosomal protein L33 isoform X2 n=1 Tax=Calliopsis andreniformis TaxID=337506 RepID=UPI003FCE3232
MFLTNILLKKAKSKCVLVFIKSAASDHQYVMCRQRLADKLEMVKWDPFVQAMVLYKEAKKIKSIFAEKLTRRISERFFNERLIWFLTAQLLYHHYLFIEKFTKRLLVVAADGGGRRLGREAKGRCVGISHPSFLRSRKDS